MTNLELMEDPVERLEIVRPDPTGLSNAFEGDNLHLFRWRWKNYIERLRYMRDLFGSSLESASDYVDMPSIASVIETKNKRNAKALKRRRRKKALKSSPE